MLNSDADYMLPPAQVQPTLTNTGGCAEPWAGVATTWPECQLYNLRETSHPARYAALQRWLLGN